MTLDEARTILGVARGASHADIRDAFRRRARLVHPDAHPTVSVAQRSDFARQFDRAREARDILLLLPDATFAPEGAPRPAAPPPGATASSAATNAPAPGAPSAPSPPPWRPSRDPSPPPQRTLRFDEFVQVVDAAGFGPGHRSAPARRIALPLVWLAVGAVSFGVLISVVWMALVT